MFKTEGDLFDCLEHRGGRSRSNESGRGTSIDEAIVVLKEKVREEEDAVYVSGDGHLVLLEELVKFRNHELGHSVELNL